MKTVKTTLLCVLLMACTAVFAQSREGLSTYTLDNGLTVYLWEDHNAPDVTGYVAVRAGSIDEPMEYTGLAHYLEHMLFKGTEKIGSVDWEKEKPLYEQIIRLYDEYSDATDPKVREELTTKINEASLEAAKYSTTEDFFNLMDFIGAEGVNAYTSYDMTCYHNSFSATQMQRWLTIFSDRLINPVFRTFQAELENVFEEYNMYEDNISSHIRKALFKEVYDGHPYDRDVIGVPEHLKNPRLSRLIEFYNTWYVPNNMALILVGDFNTEKTKPLIEQTFGRLQYKELPARKQYPKKSFAGNPKKSYKIGYNPEIVWVYDGVKKGDPDEIALQFASALLSNGTQTGLLDKITADGIINGADFEIDSRRDMGRIMIMAVPYFDVSQQQFESNSATEKIVFKEVDKLKNGEIDDWMMEVVKKEAVQNYTLAFERPSSKLQAVLESFIYNQPVDDIFTELNRFLAVTKEDVQRVAQKYLNADHLTISFDEGTPKKNKLAKPKIKPLDPVKGVETDYSKAFKQIPMDEVKEEFLDFDEVKVLDIDKNVRLHYMPNEQNNIFSLRLRYGVGTEKLPMLEYSVDLMNRAGILPNTTPQQFRRQLAELGARCSYSVNDSYLTLTIIGDDAKLKEICNLVNRQLLMPKLDERQFESVRGQAWRTRYVISKYDELLGQAMLEYTMYGDKSDFIDMVPFKDVYFLEMSKVNATFLGATKYALDVYYTGTHAVNDVIAALPLQEGVQPSESPVVKDRKTYDKTQVYFLPNSNVQQATVYFYFNGQPYTVDQAVDYMAFNQYFTGGFTGLVLDEIRAKRSMAYTAQGYMATAPLPNKKGYFIGYIGTQSDKVADAIDVFMSLLDSMPQYPERIESIKAALRESVLTNKPDFRSKSYTYDRWREVGYTDDPAKINLPKIDALKFEQIVDFYEKYVKGQPVTILVIGDPKLINQKQIQAKYGKINKLNRSKLFAPLDIDW